VPNIAGDSQNGGIAVNSFYTFVTDSPQGLMILSAGSPVSLDNSSAPVSDYTNGPVIIDLVLWYGLLPYLLPLDGCWRFRRNVVNHTAYLPDRVGYKA
jgi:hypothetical protein